MNKVMIFVAAISILVILGCSGGTEEKIEELRNEADQLRSEGKILEATEALKEANALARGEEYERDEDPQATMEQKYEDNFSYIDITNTSVEYGDINGKVVGTMKNNHYKNLKGYFGIIFYKDGEVIETYTAPIPGEEGLVPGVEAEFSVSINQFEYDSYEVKGRTVVEN